MTKVTLLIIDPQVDFHPGGSLAVAGADEDSKRIADFIDNNIDNIDEIYVTLDTHHASAFI
jgi:nicotinamidase-related amidase